MRKIIIILGSGVLMMGVVWTVFEDYLPWRHAENDNFGQGPGEVGSVGIVNKMFQESGALVRINYPESWKVRNVWGNKGWKPATDVVIFSPMEGDIKVTVSRFEVQGSLVDLADKMVMEKKVLGWIAQERQYITAKEDVTILTWEEKQANGEIRMRQTALAKNGNVLIEVDAYCSIKDWKTNMGIFWEMYKSLVII
jgi:hypothetical protein